MLTKGFKAGIGTASRVAGPGTVGVLTLANFDAPPGLVVDGVPVGDLLGTARSPRREAGSCIVVVAVGAPVSAGQLERVARRAGLGLARGGSVGHHGSGGASSPSRPRHGWNAERPLSCRSPTWL